jgi:monothiol glutaredoxin
MDKELEKRIKDEIEANSVLLFMKGTKEAPQCGFSAQVVKILEAYAAEFKTINVLEDDEIREGIKEFSNWPTIPQLYVNGEFVGGCDIAMDLHRKGKMAEVLEKSKN